MARVSHYAIGPSCLVGSVSRDGEPLRRVRGEGGGGEGGRGGRDTNETNRPVVGHGHIMQLDPAMFAKANLIELSVSHSQQLGGRPSTAV